MNIINIIVSEKGYKDRFAFFCSLDNKVTKQIIYTKSFQTNYDLINTEIRIFNYTGISFWYRVAIDIYSELKNKNEKWIVVEHLTGFTLFFLKLFSIFKNKLNIIPIYGVYSEEFRNLRERLWLQDCPPKLSMILSLSYLFHTWKKAVRCDFFLLFAKLSITNSITFVDYVSSEKKKPAYWVPNTINSFNLESSIKTFDLLYCGSIRSSKGIGRLLKAVDILHKQGISVSVKLVGGIYKEDIKWVHDLKKLYLHLNVDFIPRVDRDELNKLFKSCKLFVYPSLTEGYPRVVLEAISMGAPILISDIDAHLNLDREKKYLKYFNTYDEINLAENIQLLLKNPQDNFISSYEEILKRHNENTVGENLLRFYKKIIENA